MVGQVLEHRIVTGDPDDVAAVVAVRDSWLEKVASAATSDAKHVDAQLRAELGRSRAKTHIVKRARVEIGEPRRTGAGYMIPIEWEASGFEGLFPVMDAMIEILPAGHGKSSVTFWGRYDPPLGRLGDLADRYIANRVARATVGSLLDAIAARCAEARAAV